uniref:Photosystem I P700 chlorophyll a apoprotein A2 n=1 Tax=Solanum lycopersicum TaxID=4081 RepID=K4DDW8_SOLLC
MFLFGHPVWATGFMFLISWRGYWQKLIETLAWAHEHIPLANLIRWRDKLVALSIVQARLVGLAHFSVGYILTYAAFLTASTSGLKKHVPPLACFLSKDEIFNDSLLYLPIFAIIAWATAGLTAFYIFRIYLLTFEGHLNAHF